MAVYLWSTLSDGQTIAPFDPSVDVLRFDSSSIKASLVQLDPAPGELSFTYEGKTVTVAMELTAVTTVNVTFINSILRVGDNDVGAGDDLGNGFRGGSGRDQLIGLGGNDEIRGGDGSDLLDGGDGNDTLTGAVEGDESQDPESADTMFGGLGDDTYRVTGNGSVVVERAGEGIDTLFRSVDFSRYVLLPEHVENLRLFSLRRIDIQAVWGGTGDGNVLDNGITGSQYDDLLRGNDGNDTLNGSSGEDTLVGGAGDDLYIISNIDMVSEGASGSGIDTVQATGSYTLGGAFEHLVLAGTSATDGTGNSLGNRITGDAFANVLSGLGGDDTLNGGDGNDTLVGGNGVDALSGGMGDDVYQVPRGDMVIESFGEGFDRVETIFAYMLDPNIEGLTLTGSADVTGDGNELGNHIVGNSGNNRLRGNAGNDTLNGGSGIDTLVGGAGDDLYILDDAGDAVSEGPGGNGFDTVQSAFDYALGAPFEALTLMGAAINGTGNTLANVITGNALANLLLGLTGNDTLMGGEGDDTLNGGAHVDSMVGGDGSDTYIVDRASDRASELDGGGTDTVESSVGYALGDNVENLTLTGTANTNGVGNALGNILTGNSGNNQLRGGDGNDTLDGAAGADTVIGGLGDDLYIISTPGDIVSEGVGGGGLDTVRSAIDFVLSPLIENLELTGIAVNGTGSENANLITGNGQANVLSGLAGDDTITGDNGADTINGGAGNDSISGGDNEDVLAGGDDDDVLAYDLANASADGGDGIDTLQFAGEELDLTLIPDGEITGIEIVELTSAQGNVTLALNDVLAASASTDELRIIGIPGGSFTLADAGSWSPGADQEIDGMLFRVYTQSTATLLVDVDIAG